SVDFTHSFYESGLQIMVLSEAEESSGWSVIGALFSEGFVMVLGVFGLVLLLCGHAVWFFERKREDSDFRPEYVPGVWDGFWWAAVTVTTVGYGDKAPKGNMGRIIGLVWMFISLFIISYFTASVTTSLTLDGLRGGIQGPADLPGAKITTPQETTAANYLKASGAHVVVCEVIDDCYARLATRDVAAVVFDAPVMQYYAANHPQQMFMTVGPIFQLESYGIAVQSGSHLREDINKALLAMREDGTYQEIQEAWFGLQ
ncbi:MAG: transporter substrate-binding domain-containing protein, partial [Myxococcota bacterium]|nr:transporter substrate-binding domain-containing protein [Myxococcota bacterium]